MKHLPAQPQRDPQNNSGDSSAQIGLERFRAMLKSGHEGKIWIVFLPEECWCAHLVLHHSLNECLQSCRISQLPCAWDVIWWGDLGGHSCSVVGEIMAVMLVCTVVYSRDASGTSPTGGCVGSWGCAKEFSKRESVHAGISRLVYTQALWGHLTSLLGSVSIHSLKASRTLPSPICSKGIHTACL